MGREHSPKGQVVLKKDEKLDAAVAALPADSKADAIAAKFRELYPDDWGRIVSRYNKHKKISKPGKRIPMPPPEKYLSNMVGTYLSKKSKVAR
jgi:hypothetical protein